MKVAHTLICILSLTIGATVSSVLAINRALSLDGEKNYVQFMDSESFHSFTNAITIEVWFNASSFYTITGNVNSIIRKNISANAENFFLRFRIIDGKPQVEMTAGSRIGILRAPYNFVTDKWYHLVGTYDGNTTKAFVNGVNIGRENFFGPMYIDASDVIIGKAGPEYSFGEYFHGMVDEIRIWNVARTQEEIQATMNTTLTGQEKGLVGYWNFDDGTANDLSKNGNDGMLHEGASIVEEKLPDEFIHKGMSAVVLEDKVANPGDQFTVHITVRFAELLNNFSFDLTFDPAVLRAVSVKEGLFLSRDGVDTTSWQTPTIDNKNGVISNIRCSRTDKKELVEKGVLATVTFETRDMGDTDVIFKNLRFLSPTGEEIKVSAKEGRIKVYPHGSISGVVLDAESEKPIKGARVEVSKGNFAFGLWTYSADDGRYAINGVPVGDFDVTASKDDYTDETISKVHIEQGENTPDINLKMMSW